ncbi:MAG: Clp protease ClpP [Bergeyella cardium]|nr:MAG TPA: Putative ATP dependent Clp protease [Caudoviricetes sp.]
MILARDNNELYLLGTIWSGDGMWFVSEFAKMEKQYDDITIKIHTYGGSVFDGNIMCNAIERSKANISIEVIGVAASMGAILTMSSKNVKIVENGFLMLHAPHSYTTGDAKTHESTAKLLRSMESQFLKKLAIRLREPEDAVRKYLQGDNWVDAEEALKLGLVSEIIPSKVETILPIERPEDLGEMEVYNRFCAILTQVPQMIQVSNEPKPITDNSNVDNNKTMKQLLITTFALSQLTEQSSDTAVINALKDKFKALENDLKTAHASKIEADKKLQNYENARIDAMIADAKLSDEQKEVYQKIGRTSGVEALAEILKDKHNPQAPNLSAMIQTGGNTALATGRESWDFDKWQKEDPKGLEKLSQEAPEKFQTLFNAKYK